MREYDESRINCKRCGDETNHVPPEFPEDWDGYCPQCAGTLAVEGVLSKADPVAMIGQIVGKLNEMIGGGIEICVVNGGFEMVDSDDKGATFIARQCLN